jgi:dephospho-CoA kinase
MKGQLSDEEFRKHCQVVITNNGNLEETYNQIKKAIGSRF